ncbi:MAG: response regulator, partial [Gammaproteobacteria bacterium]
MIQKLTQILVVDGSEVSRTVVSRILSEEMTHASITTCGSAGEARQLLEEQRFDLITTALMLPDRDGLELSRH